MAKMLKIAATLMIVCSISLGRAQNRDYGVIKNQDSPKTTAVVLRAALAPPSRTKHHSLRCISALSVSVMACSD